MFWGHAGLPSGLATCSSETFGDGEEDASGCWAVQE